jgi:electron-transferring-flavoprotein dehydrogenase
MIFGKRRGVYPARKFPINKEKIMEKTVDVLVVGGCTTGLYFAGLMAEKGFTVLVCDKSPEHALGGRYDVIHVGKGHFPHFGITEPKPGDPDYVDCFDRSILRSASNKWPKLHISPILVLRRIPLMKRIAAWAKSKGAELLCETAFEKPVFDAQGLLTGGVFRQGNGELRVKARLTVDASGIPAVVRTSLPDNYGVENAPLTNNELSYVIIHYVKLLDPKDFVLPSVTTWVQYRIWVGPSYDPQGALLGIGARDSFENAEAMFDKFTKTGYLPEYEVDHIEKCLNTRRRTPHSFVADGFIAMGDAACITNPWTGEGVPDTWVLCSIAAEEFEKALRNGAYPRREAVWPVNRRYISEQGALFAGLFATRYGFTGCTPEENDYMFEHDIFYADEEKRDKGDLVTAVTNGRNRGKISAKSAEKMLDALKLGKAIHAHYEKYPENPADFEAWVREADKLWNSVGEW